MNKRNALFTLALTLPVFVFAADPATCFEEGYTQVYELDLKDTGSLHASVPYSLDSAATFDDGSFSRIAYRLELEESGNTECVWVSADAFTNDASLIGVPSNAGSGAIFQEILTNMNVISTQSGIVTGEGISTGNIEFWPNSYTSQNSQSIPNADSSGDVFDFGDTYEISDTSGGTGNDGSMQIHNHGASQTLFAINGFASSTKDIGIGNQPIIDTTDNPDWTSAANSADYSTQKLSVYIKRNTEGQCGPGLHKATGLKIDSDGTDSQINTVTEAIAIWDDWVAEGQPTSGLISSGTYNISATGTSYVNQIDFGGFKAHFSKTLPYPGMRNGVLGNDFTVQTNGFITLSPGDYTFFVSSDDGFRLLMTPISGDEINFSKFGKSTAGASNELLFNSTNGNTDTGGSFTLTRESVFEMHTLLFNRGGGNSGNRIEIGITDSLTADDRMESYEVLQEGALSGAVAFDDCGIPEPAVEYRFDEPSWDGTTGEVIDTSGNTSGATANASTATNVTTNGFLCSAASFDGNQQYITGADLTALEGTSTLSFWIKTEPGYVGFSERWQRPGVIGIEHAGDFDDIQFGVIDDNGRIGLTWGADEIHSTNPINDGNYQHVAITVDHSTNAISLFINGTLDDSLNATGQPLYDSFTSIGRIEYTASWLNHTLAADIDELLIFSKVLSADNISELYQNQLNGLNYDGTPRDCPIPAPVVEYRFDEYYWDGTAGEVLDNTGNTAGATANINTGTSLTDEGAICNAASFDGNQQYLTGADLTALESTSTLLFWIKTEADYVGDSRRWRKPGLIGLERFGEVDDATWGIIDDQGNIGMAWGDEEISSTTPINSGDYHHVALTVDHSTNEMRVYIDGSFSASFVAQGQPLFSSYTDIGRVVYSDSLNSTLAADIDEILIFDTVLSANNINEIYQNQLNGLNYDGSTRSCEPARPAICMFDDFDRADLGSDWATGSSSGAFGQPVIVNNRLRLTNQTIRNSTSATLLRVFPSSGNRVVTEFDYYGYDGSPNAADGITFVFSDAAITPQPGTHGAPLGYAQGESTDGFAGGWAGIGLDVYGNFINLGYEHSGAFGSRVPETVTIRGSGSGTSGYNYIVSNGNTPSSTAAPSSLSPTVQTSTGHRYRISIDNTDSSNAWVSVKRDDNLDGSFTTLIDTFDLLAQTGQADLPDELYVSITGSTGGGYLIQEIDNFQTCANSADTVDPAELVHHYELDRNQDQGLTCEPIVITSRACTNADCSSQVSVPVTTEFSPATGWGGGNTQTYTGEADIDFLQTSAGTYTLDILSSSIGYQPYAEPLTCLVGGVEQANCDVEFVNSALQFFDSALSTTPISVVDVIASDQSSELFIRAIETNPSTGQCQAVFNSASTINITAGTTCTNPATCAQGQHVTFSQSADTILANPENPISGQSTNSVPVSFGNNGTAQLTLNANDLGLQPLSLSYALLDVNGNPTGDSIDGAITVRSRPASLVLSNAPSSSTLVANSLFTADITALDSAGDTLRNLGRLNTLPEIDWTQSTLNSPIGGVLGTLTSNSPSSQWEGVDLIDSDGNQETLRFSGTNGLTYSEVGAINLVANTDDFLGSGVSINSSAEIVGRFIPDYLTVTSTITPDWGGSTAAYQGKTDSLGTVYLSIEAFDASGNRLNNYDGSSLNLGLPSNTNAFAQNAAQSLTGGSLLTDTTWSLTDNNDFDGSVSFQTSSTDLTWLRNPAGFTANDTPITVSNLILEAATFTDTDGVCFETSSGAGCSELIIDIADNTLYYSRLNADNQVSALTNAFIPLTLEYLNSVDAAGNASFNTQTTESDFDSSIIAGLDFISGGLCSIAGCDGAGSTIADSADGSLADGVGAGSTLLNGLGSLTTTSATTLNGIVQTTPSIPNWLYWDWDGTGIESAPSVYLLFGNYQGRTPILFTRPQTR